MSGQIFDDQFITLFLEQMIDPTEATVSNMIAYIQSNLKAWVQSHGVVDIEALHRSTCRCCQLRLVDLVYTRLNDAMARLQDVNSNEVVKTIYDSVLSRIILADEDDERVIDNVNE